MSEPNREASEDLRYPVGRFAAPAEITPALRNDWIATLEALPSKLRAATSSLTEAQQDTPYRPGGWTVRQVVHHLADSHSNASLRIRLALTEDTPPVKPYFEAKWAELPDAKTEDIAVSLRLLEALHRRLTTLLKNMTDEQFARKYRHPDMGEMPMDKVLGLYAWHSRHHLAHITGLRERSGW